MSAPSLKPTTMASREKITSAFAPDLEELRAWLQKMLAGLRFVELVTAILAISPSSVATECGLFPSCLHSATTCALYSFVKVLRRRRYSSAIFLDAMVTHLPCPRNRGIANLPVERQCARFARSGVDVAPQTLGRSVAAAVDLLAPVAHTLHEQTRGPGLLGTDATGIPVLDPDAPEGIRNGTMWAWTNARWVTFSYSKVGDAESVKRFLGPDLARTVQCDGTSITTFLERTGGKRPGCWAHARRRLVEAARGGDRIALEGVRILARLFAVERESTCAGDGAEQRRARRFQFSRPILDELRAWIERQKAIVPPRTALGKGLGYLERQWPRLLLFLDDGNIEATNNRRERELRRLVLGRKNWLFTWLDEGAERTADILSIVATCIAHDVNPRAYLHLVTKLLVNGWPQAKLRELLPDRMLASHPELYVGDPDALPIPPTTRALTR
jgi:transposase